MKKSVFEQILEEMEQEKYRFVPDAVMWILGGIPWFLDSAEDVCAARARRECVEIFGKCFV